MVLPHVTESYGDSADPPEPAVPVCTLKSFPYKIEHTIQWARELFEECFTATPARAEAMVAVATEAHAKAAAAAAQDEIASGEQGDAVAAGTEKEKKKKKAGSGKKHGSRSTRKAQDQQAARAVVAAALEANDDSGDDALVMLQRAGHAVKCLEEAVSSSASSSSTAAAVTLKTAPANTNEGDESGGLLATRCLEWAAFELVREKVVGEVQAVLAQHPPGTIDAETGLPFWQGTRRLPAAPSIDTNPHGGQAALVVAAARLRVDNLLGSVAAQRADAIAGLTAEAAAEALARVAKRTATTQQAPKKRDASEEVLEAEASLEGSGNDVGIAAKDKSLLAAAAVLVKHARWRQASSKSANKNGPMGPLQPLEFEKDDDSNGHLAFVAAASNLRASCYRIPPADALATKLTAGRIVPAIATTTSVVAGLSALELVKMAALRQHQKRTASKTENSDGSLEERAAHSPLKVHRNAFLSLALPVFAFSEPVAAAVYPYGNIGLSDDDEDDEEEGDEEGSDELGEAGRKTYPATFTTWDRLQIDGRHGTLPLSEVVASVERAAGPGAVLRSLSFGGRLLFTDYPPFDLPSRLRKPILEILEEDPRQGTGGGSDDYSGRGERLSTASADAKQSLTSSFTGKQFVDLEALVEDEEDGELLDMPPVRIYLEEHK